MRIVSLVPSATEIVCELGLSDQLVGISADSAWPADVVQALPILNTVAINPDQLSSAEIDAAASSGHNLASLYHVDPERLRVLHPDVILTQETCEVCAVSRADVELATRTLGYRPDILSLSPANLDQMLDDVSHVAAMAGVTERGAQLTSSLRARIDAVRAGAARLDRPRVFCMEWLDPPWTAGHWVPEMVELAGGNDELGTSGGPSRRIQWREVLDYAPEVVVLMPCSLGLDRVAAEFDVVRTRAGWSDLPAARTGKVFAGSTDLFSCAGPRLVDGLDVLARMLHPEVFTQPIPDRQALKISPDGRHLVPYR